VLIKMNIQTRNVTLTYISLINVKSKLEYVHSVELISDSELFI